MGIRDDGPDDAPRDDLDAALADLGSPATILRLHGLRIAFALAAFAFAAVRRDVRLVLLGLGMLIQPVAHAIAVSGASPRVKAAARSITRPLRLAFVVYCAFIMIQALQGR